MPYLEVTKPLKGHVFTIPNRAPAELPGTCHVFFWVTQISESWTEVVYFGSTAPWPLFVHEVGNLFPGKSREDGKKPKKAESKWLGKF